MSSVAPESSAALRPVPLAARLRVPLAARGPADGPSPVAVGTIVAKGELLAAGPAAGEAAALAPTSGRVVGVTEVTLTNGQAVPAVELEADFQDRAPHEDHDMAAAARDLAD